MVFAEAGGLGGAWEYNKRIAPLDKEFSMPAKDYTIYRIGELGKEIYREQIKHLVEPRENGKFIVIDIESGDYEIDGEHLTASRRLWERRPDSVRYASRVGNLAAYHIGWDAPSPEEAKFTVPDQKYTTEEICARGVQIYQEQIKPLVEPWENGKFIAIDIESGDYEIAEKMLIASHRLRDRLPDAIRFGGRVGYPSAYRIGWRGQDVRA